MSQKRGALTRSIENDVGMLERHVTLLRTVMKSEPIGIIRLAELMALPEHKVRYSLRILEQDGLIQPSPNGAKTTPKVREFLAELDATLDHFKSTVDSLREGLR